MKIKMVFLLNCIFMAIMISISSSLIVHADGKGYISAGNGVMTFIDQPITVSFRNKTIYIEGTGEIPDFTPESLSQRPWHYLDYDYVNIADGITRIGSYAFADKPVKRISMSASTFVTDGTCFQNVGLDVILRIRGISSSTEQFGNIKYESLDSIIANAPNGTQCSFVLDNANALWNFWSKIYPYLPYVYAENDSEKPWEEKKNMVKDIDFKAVCRKKYSAPGATINMHGRVAPQGEMFMQFLAGFLKDYMFDCTYVMTLDSVKGTQYGTNSMDEYILYLKDKDQIANRKYCLIQFRADGQVVYLEDLDQDCKTVTFATDYPTATYALVYKY